VTAEEVRSHLKGGGQILKTRDDHAPILLQRDGGAEEPSKPFKLFSDATCSWTKADDSFGPEKLRPRIEPWLTALVQSEHLSLMVGSGLTHAAHGIATEGPLSGMGTITFDILSEEIEAEASRAAELAGRDSGNFEDQIRAANELLRGLEIIAATKPEETEEHGQIIALRSGLEKALHTPAGPILEGERNLISAPAEKREEAFKYLASFLMSFASRSGTRERLHLFTTNYDRYLEAGADVAGLRLIDRFVGTVAPVFRASRLDVDLHYNPPGIRGEPRYLEGVARFTKLHGSVDWVACDRAIRRIGLPLGAAETAPYLAAAGADGAMRLMIYPNAAKDRETTSHPYVELIRDFAAAICRPNSTVICYGYGFGDEHINRVMMDMLTIPSAHLVVISRDDRLGRIMPLGRHAQVSLMIGDHLGDLQTLVDHYLPKPAIDRATIRMAKLLRDRFGGGEPRTGAAGEAELPDGGQPA
jgi:hypothetical protein